MKPKIGDKVYVKKDLEVNSRYDNCLFIEAMSVYKGQLVTIENIFTHNR